jgi:hypothetical protein
MVPFKMMAMIPSIVISGPILMLFGETSTEAAELRLVSMIAVPFNVIVVYFIARKFWPAKKGVNK